MIPEVTPVIILSDLVLKSDTYSVSPVVVTAIPFGPLNVALETGPFT